MESKISVQKRICLKPLESCMIEKVNQTLSWSLVKRCCLEAKSPASSGPFPMHSAKKKKKKIAPSREGSRLQQTLVTAVSPDLPACHVCLPRCVAWGSLHHACCPWRIFFFLLCCRWHSLWESTYVQDHWFPAHSAPCSCRMGIFVKRWSSFYACHWMTVKEKRHGAKTGDV